MKIIIYGFIFICTVFISCVRKYPLSLGGKFVLDYDANSYFVINKLPNNWVEIDSHIIGYNVDSDYIVVEQKPWEEIVKKDTTTKYDEHKKFFSNNTMRHYWIIDKRDERLYGPYNKSQYFHVRDSLGVPEQLQIISINN